jgi:LmbE family N-acetylglucosaminyl deacetylase
MKPTPISPPNIPLLLVFGAHPDDIEFGCGGVVAKETQSGRQAHLVVCSRGEAGSRGTPVERVAEATAAAEALGASIEFIELDGDAHLEIRAAHAIALAGIIRERKPSVVLAPSLVQNQHPDHWRLGTLVRDASRLARYGGLSELLGQAPHAIELLLFYGVTPDAEPADISPVFVDVSSVVDQWTLAMEAHRTQVESRGYVELQLARARSRGLQAGVGHATALFPNDPPLIGSLAQLGKGARHF